MEILYFMGILSFLAVYNFIEKSYKSNKSIFRQVFDSIGENSGEIDIDLIRPENVWEKSKQFEGDIILNDDQKKEILGQMTDGAGATRNIIQNLTRRWPNKELVYKISKGHFSPAQVNDIYKAFDTLSQHSCIKFRLSEKTDKNILVIRKAKFGCTSKVGLQGGIQYLNLDARFPSGQGCFSMATLVHELLHTLGFFHMHSDSSRDKYVEVEWKNIKPQFYPMFLTINARFTTNFGLEYDYNSVMHYSSKAFSENGKDTLIPKKAGKKILKHEPFSKIDIKKLKMLYNCK